jgi:phage gp45-like
MLARMARRIMMTVMRGKVRLVDDSGPVQKHQVDFGPIGPDGSLGLRDNTLAPAWFGFASSPPEGADVVALFVGGDRANGLVIAHNHQATRLRGLNPGETALYDKWGNSVKLTQAGIEITHSAKITLTAPIVDVEGELQVGGVAVTVP